jgi:hypothetical protein
MHTVKTEAAASLVLKFWAAARAAMPVTVTREICIIEDYL